MTNKNIAIEATKWREEFEKEKESLMTAMCRRT